MRLTVACILAGSVEKTDERFEVEVPSTAVVDMSGISAGTSVSIVVVATADTSPPTLPPQGSRWQASLPLPNHAHRGTTP